MSHLSCMLSYIATPLSNQRKVNLMAHELEMHDGQVSFASLREPAWHGLGTVFEQEVSTQEMLSLAHLDNWNVRLEEIDIPETFRSDKSHYFVTRTNPFERSENDILGVVGERYNVVQNEELFSFGDTILDGGGRWETAGSIKGGRQVFGSIALERESVIDPFGVSDVVKTYLLVNTSHDGSVAIQASVTPVRVVCANTLNVALGGRGRNAAKQSFKIRHTQTANGKVQAAREALGITNAYMDKFDVMAKELFAQEVRSDLYARIIQAAYPMPETDSKGSLKKWETKVDLIDSIYSGPTNNMISGTGWGVLNAMTERLDWYRTARGGNQDNLLISASGFDAAINAEKNRLLTVTQGVLGLV